MKKIVKQVVGIDVAKDELVVCIGRLWDDYEPELVSHKTVKNNPNGFAQLLAIVSKITKPEVPVRYVMEATGVYHESLAYYLHEKGLAISIVLPNKINQYAKTLSTKTVTDKTASEAITTFGLERKLDNWEPRKEVYKRLQQLTRERDQLIEERTVIKNQLHAESAEASPNKASIQRAEKRITLINKQEKEIKAEIDRLTQTEKEVKEQIQLLNTIPGIGKLSAAIILAETNAFELIRNKRQLTSYAGLDIQEKQSGTSVYKKAHISKRGNRHLRKAMHLPALSAIQHSKRYKDIFTRIVSKSGIKMKAVVAIQRKLLELTYIVYKTQKPYDENYLEQVIKMETEAIGV